jgi:hypothetical protein
MATPPAYQYRLEIQRLDDGTWFPGEPIPDAYLQPARDEAVFRSQRKGLTGPAADQARIAEEPIFGDAGGGQVAGLRILAGADDRQVQAEFGLDLFAPAARRQAARLADQGQLPADARFLYRVFAGPAEAPADPPGLDGVTATVSRRPLPLLDGRLADWRAAATPVGPVDDELDHPLFITDRALELSREYSRKPGENEGGALLVGRLYRQAGPEPEIFAVLDGAIEARHAENQPLSLDLTAATFAYFDLQLERRRTRLGRVHEVALAFAHAHNFLPAAPEDRQRCGECHLRASCPFSSSFYSSRDAEFHRALFARQPYAVGLVWGYQHADDGGRREDDLRVYCLHGNQPRRRGFYRIPHNKAAAGEAPADPSPAC